MLGLFRCIYLRKNKESPSSCIEKLGLSKFPFNQCLCSFAELSLEYER
jgi:hypothetical protein